MTVKKEDDKTVEKPNSEAKAPAVKVGTNPLKLQWPTDPHGQISSLKRGGIDAAKRVNGDPEKLKRLVKALRIIEAHAKERFARDKATRVTAKENAVSARARVAEKQRRNAEARARDLEAQAKAVRRSVN